VLGGVGEPAGLKAEVVQKLEEYWAVFMDPDRTLFAPAQWADLLNL
jgi:hypothetical protein